MRPHDNRSRQVLGDVGVRRWALIPVIALASCADTDGRSGADDNRRSATDQNAEIAADDCGIDEWHWASMIAFDGPQPEEPYFAYDLQSLPSEEIETTTVWPDSPILDDARSWDRTERIETINACLNASFEKQEVRVNLAAPALVETVVDQESFKNDPD
jgi:hypothetical protein